MRITEQGTACGAAAFIGARVFVEDGHCSTDSSLVYELVELGRQFDEFFLHCFVIEGERARDTLQLPPSVQLVDLGRVTCGRDLYGHPIRLWRRVHGTVRQGGWTYAVLVEPRLPSLFALLACGLAARPAIALIRGDPAAVTMAHRYRRGTGALLGRALRYFGILVEGALASAVTVVADSDTVCSRLARRGTTVHQVAAASVSEADVLPPGPSWGGAGEGPLRLLYVGRLERVKDIETLLQAVHLGAVAGGHFALRIVGSGDPDYTSLLRARVRELNLERAVEFVGPIPHGPQLYKCYQQAHVLVMSSRSEGMPKAVIEAMAHGLPVVATAVGGLPRIVPPEVGILVEPGDAVALGEALCTMHDLPTLSRTMGDAARQRVGTLLAGSLSRELATVLLGAAHPPWRQIKVLRSNES